MHRATNYGSRSSKLGGGVSSIESLVIIKKSMGGSLISLVRRWKVRVMGDHLLASANRRALSAYNIGKLRKGPKPMAFTLSWTWEHMQPHKSKNPDEEPWHSTFPLACKRKHAKLCQNNVYKEKKAKITYKDKKYQKQQICLSSLMPNFQANA